MSTQDGPRPAEILARLSPAEREALLVKCWMSHDARWFMAVAEECGMAVANRLNRIAAHELGKAEARRIARALRLSPPTTLDEYLAIQETFIALLGPELLEYAVARVSETACRMDVRRCFAYDNATRAGVADRYECGIFPRVTGWLDGLGLAWETSPPPGKCLKAQGRECVYTIALRGRSGDGSPPDAAARGRARA